MSVLTVRHIVRITKKLNKLNRLQFFFFFFLVTNREAMDNTYITILSERLKIYNNTSILSINNDVFIIICV